MKTWVLGIAVFVCFAGALYQWLGAVLAARWLREPQRAPERLPPVTLLRPLKAGVPDLRGKLERLVRAMRPGDQLVLGAAENSEELAACLALADDFPERDVAVVPCREGAAVNPKISKLVQMEPAARHEHLILSDSEALIDGPWLDALRGEWETSGADVLTTAYFLVGARTWPQRFDAAGILFSLWPGLALVRRWGRTDFTLGACTAMHRGHLAEVGGWPAFGEYLAEDRQLGVALAARGRSIRLATAVTKLDADPLGWRDWWRHQCRVAATYRVSAPMGFAGMLVTHSVAASLVLVIGGGWWGLGLAALLCAARWQAARRLAALMGAPRRGLFPSLFAAGLVETLCWCLSWFSGGIWWGGLRWRLDRHGSLAAPSPNPSVTIQ